MNSFHDHFVYISIGQCYDILGDADECSSEQCIAEVSLFEEIFVSQDCADDGDTRPIGLYFTLTLNSDTDDIVGRCTFVCNYDKCNDASIMEQVVEIFDQEYNIVEVLKVFGYDEDDAKNKTTIISTMISTDSVQSSMVTESFVSSSNTYSPTISDINNTVATTKANHGFHLQSVNIIIYITLIIVSCWSF